MRLRILVLLSFAVFVPGCTPAELTTLINTTNKPVTLQIHREGVNDPQFATRVIEVPAHASAPGTDLRGANVDVIEPDGLILFHQGNIFPWALTAEYVGEEHNWLITRLKTCYAIEKDGIYLVPVKYWDSVDNHLDEIQKRP